MDTSPGSHRAVRDTEAHACNDVLREMLKPTTSDDQAKSSASHLPEAPWLSKGVTVPAGTELRATYKGLMHTAKIARGRLLMGRGRSTSLSHAARCLTNSSVGGWVIWKVKCPGDTVWREAHVIRDSASPHP